MAKLSEKYLAGFLDSDGSIQVVMRADCNYPMLSLQFSQVTSQDEVLHRIQQDYGGALNYRPAREAGEPGGKASAATFLTFGSKASRLLLSRIHKYLVVKRHYAEVCLDVIKRPVTENEHETVRAYLRAQRKVPSTYMPNYPSRKWMAGYLDGDGCFSIQRLSKLGNASLIFHVSAAKYDDVGLRLLHKAFGGRLHDMCGGGVTQWCLPFPPSKAKEVIAHCGQYLIVKKDQADFVKGCAEMGHYRDGSNIKAALKQLKAHPHRLSEPNVNVPAMLALIQDIPPRQRQDYGAFERDASGRITGKRGVSDSRTAL